MSMRKHVAPVATGRHSVTTKGAHFGVRLMVEERKVFDDIVK